ncbi:rho guanine nucleotide exchange factor 12 isoform X6 [Phlebotomus papatasi]|uniref:rho guanine nucleotide exchange factor 12 isoform X6 n=1 Tax=Phlebotomus papatasi TaxID=29031 RepID=UPI002483B0F6|nr:rho guanine nucleotide exchange factor 12 isoform X6 [Phlebotomus papatasi]
MDNLSTPPQESKPPPPPPTSSTHRVSTGNGSAAAASQMNGAGPRRPQTLMSPLEQQKFIVPAQSLTLTIHKDSNGYGMKVSGDNPVFVESVKPNGAAQKAGLIASDMILKVNGTPVRYSTHTDVVKLIKSSATVELTVQRGHKMQRPSSISVGPSTPLAQRGGITAPIPVDQHKMREMEFSKMQTLRLMLDQEKKNYDALLAASNSGGGNRQEMARSEANIRKLQEQLRQVCGEALGLTPQQLNQLSGKHRRVISSPEHVHPSKDSEHSDSRMNKSATGSWDLMEKDNERTPPGTPPPPYLSPGMQASGQMGHQKDESAADSTGLDAQKLGSPVMSPTFHKTSISAAQANILQKPIISMEDDEISDQEGFIEEHGPFRSLSQLLEQENSSYLAVFLNFVLSNSNPAPLLFYLITGLYKEGSVKDMRKWAYEIHSTFLVPQAPLLWSTVDESLAREVDDVLQKEYDKGEILRKIFWKSRIKAKDFINSQLQEFQVKRTAGLGTIYGPSDQQLQEAKGDKTKEQRIVEETLIPKLQQLVDELDREAPNECPKKSALCSALSTVLHRIFVTRSNPNSPIDKVHHFVSREKSFKSRLMGKNRKALVLGHLLVLRQYYEVTHCNHCQNIIWGVSPQGYHCTHCELNIHRACSRILEEHCPGPAPQKRKDPHNDNKISKFMEKIRPTHHFIPSDRSRRQDDESGAEDTFCMDRPLTTSVTRQPSDRRPDSSSSSHHHHHHSHGSVGSTSGASVDFQSPAVGEIGETGAPVADRPSHESSKSKSAPVSVNRSESYKERLSHKRNRTNRRKTSDPSLTKTNDEQQVELGLTNANYPASSSSSLSSNSLDSPSISFDAVGAPSSCSGTQPGVVPRQWVESEDEGGGDLETDWSSNVPADILQNLSDAEKKRQEIINEIYQTERSHVRTLRLLEGIFMQPLQESGVLNIEHLHLLFPPALLILKDLHCSFEAQLKQRRIDSGSIVGHIGDLLLATFDGNSGEELKENAAQFCARQQIALEALKENRRKDENLQRLLTKAEAHKACRRLQLKDLLPTVLQRLTKYPLLFESLYKITVSMFPENTTEAEAIKKALDNSRDILNHVNQAVRVAEDSHKLQTIQKKLDKAAIDKEIGNEIRLLMQNLDLTQHQLIHDGLLIMKKSPTTQLHGLLFDDIMVLLQKQDDRYVLKVLPNPGAGGSENKSKESVFYPIIKVNLILVRQSAVDKTTFFLINTSLSQMLELTTPSSSECKGWFKHISDAADAYKARTRGSHDLNTELSGGGSKEKDSFEMTPERSDLPSVSGTGATADTATEKKGTDDTRDRGGEVTHEKRKSQKQQQKPQDARNRSKQKKDSEENRESANEDEEGDVSDQEENEEEKRTEDEDGLKQKFNGYSSSCNTRTLTQQCSLVAPSEVQVTVSPSLTAEPVLTPAERLRRLDESIRGMLAEKQQIVCDMFRMPSEHFSAIADIAGQPEAPKDPSDLVLAAFAQVQSLTEALNDYTRVSQIQEISAVSMALCDDCHKMRSEHATRAHPVLQREDSVQEDEDGYCEIVELRSIGPPSTSRCDHVLKRRSTNSIPEETESEMRSEAQQQPSTGRIEVNETYVGGGEEGTQSGEKVKVETEGTSLEATGEFCGANRLLHATSLTPSVPCHLISSHTTALNTLVSQLLPKLNERDVEREMLRRENQHLRELINSLHERERVSESEETPPKDVDSGKKTQVESPHD